MVGGFPRGSNLREMKSLRPSLVVVPLLLLLLLLLHPFNLAPLSSSMARVTHTKKEKKSDERKRFYRRASRFPSRTLSSPLLLLVSPFLSPASLLLKNNATFSPLPPLVLCGFVVTTRLYTPIHFAPQFLATKFPTRDDALFYFSSSSPPFLFLPLFPSLHPKCSRLSLLFRLPLKRLRCPIFLRR